LREKVWFKTTGGRTYPVDPDRALAPPRGEQRLHLVPNRPGRKSDGILQIQTLVTKFKLQNNHRYVDVSTADCKNIFRFPGSAQLKRIAKFNLMTRRIKSDEPGGTVRRRLQLAKGHSSQINNRKQNESKSSNISILIDKCQLL
jgi:hypothetical protein